MIRNSEHTSPERSLSESDSEKISEYYDIFALKKLVKDFDYINIRQEKAGRLCRRFVRPQERVLEIGCGAGIITRKLIKYGAHVTAVDISVTNVRLTNLVVANPKVDVYKCDVNNKEEFGLLAQKGSFDAIVMIDVIEHIPLGGHADLLSKLESLLSPGGRLVLSFPSPDYQRHIIENEPELVQIVDEIVEVGTLLSQTVLQPIHLRSVDVGLRRQYMHLVLQKSGPDDLEPVLRSRLRKNFLRLKNVLWRLRNYKIRRFSSKLENS